MTYPKFSQPEVLVGYLQELKINAQGTHLVTIKLLNDTVVDVPLPKELAQQVENDKSELLRHDKLIELSGTAIYHSVGLSMTLDSFYAKSLRIIQNSNGLEQWISGFISCGPSGWNQLDNPMEVWLGERHE